MALVLWLTLCHHAHGGVITKVEEPGRVEIVATTRCHDDVGVAIDDGAGEHALALLARLATCGVQLDGGHACGLPAPFAEGDGEACFVEDIHGLQNEIARHTYDGSGNEYW